MAAPVLQFKRGLFSNLPALRAGEPGFTTDKYDLYVGIDSTTSNNQFVGSGRFWTIEGATSGSGVNLVEGTNNGTSYITLASPASLAGIVTYYFPGTQGGASSVLTNDGSGNLSWGAGSANSTLTGVTTVTGHFDIDSTVDISGITTVTNTTDNTLGSAGTGAFQVDGGLGVAKNVTVGGNLNVQGYAEFVGVATFKGGTINLGDADTDDINVGGEFISSLVPNADKSVDLGEFDKQWRDVYAGGSVYGYESLVSTEAANTTVTYTVTVASKTANHRYNGSGSSSGYFIDGSESPFITLVPGVTYRFDQSAGSNSGHPLRFYLEAQKTTAYTTNVTTNGTAGSAGAYTEITVTDTTPQVLHYQCSSHGLMGNAVSTQSNVVHNNFQATFLEGIAVTGVSTFTGQIDGNGGANISGAETVLSSATVSDLTDNRVVIAGSSGALEDSGNLTFNGSTLAVTGTAAVTGDVTVSDSITVTKDAVVSAGLTVTGAIDGNGGANFSGAETVLSSATVSDLTDNRVVIAGSSGALEDSANLTFDGTTLAVTGAATVDNLSLNGNTVTTSSGGLTLDSASGTTTVADDLTVNGTFTVLGSQSIINTETLKVEDSLIEVGLVNSGGNLVAPSSDANIDVGVVLHYYSGSAKTASVFWDDSAGRIVVADEVTESNSVMGSISYANLEIGALTVSDCQGNNQAVISCSGSTRNLENITVDGGSF